MGLPETITVDGLNNQEISFNIMVPANVQPNIDNAISVVVSFQDDPSTRSESQVIVLVNSDNTTHSIYMPIVAC